MNENEKYFVLLIASYLNQEEPPTAGNKIDWEEIYRLSAIHNVAAITANQILQLKGSSLPNDELLSKFRQQIGYTVIDAAEKEETVAFIKDLLCNAGIDFLFVKGAVLKQYYPIPEFRTGSDTDVIIRNEDIKKCAQVFCAKNCVVKTESTNGFSVLYKKQHIEIHGTQDYDHAFFADIFDMCTKNGNEYRLKAEYHLLYVLCHIIKHFKNCGAGIKMFMDIDVLLRREKELDIALFWNLCTKLNIETFAKASFALCHYWFKTPIKRETDVKLDPQLKELFETEILNSGNFGFNARDLGDFYINKAIGKSGKNGANAKIRAIFKMLFPLKKYLEDKYGYVKKRPYLLPLAWISRLCAAVFKRSAHSASTIRSILHTGTDAEQYKKLLNELGI